MSELIAIVYPDPYRAAEVLRNLEDLHQQYQIDIADAAIAVKDRMGKIKITRSDSLTAEGVTAGALGGLLVGLLFFVPVLGSAVGAATGAIAGKLVDSDMDEQFIQSLSQQMKANTSALFVLVIHANPEQVVAEIGKYGGKILQTTLPGATEEQLNTALQDGQARMAE